MANRCFPAQAALDRFWADEFCRHLTAAGETALVDRGYRFSYVPAFHSPRVVSVSWERGRAVVRGKVLGGRGAGESGDVLRRTQRELSASELQKLEALLRDAGLWEVPVPLERGDDGAFWLLEGRKPDHYQLHQAWSPREPERRRYREACLYMLALADILPSDPRELY